VETLRTFGRKRRQHQLGLFVLLFGGMLISSSLHSGCCWASLAASSRKTEKKEKKKMKNRLSILFPLLPFPGHHLPAVLIRPRACMPEELDIWLHEGPLSLSPRSKKPLVHGTPRKKQQHASSFLQPSRRDTLTLPPPSLTEKKKRRRRRKKDMARTLFCTPHADGKIKRAGDRHVDSCSIQPSPL